MRDIKINNALMGRLVGKTSYFYLFIYLFFDWREEMSTLKSSVRR